MGDVVNLDTGYLNDGTPWSEQDVLDLRWQIEHGRDLKETSLFLCRHPNTVAAKANELGLVFQESTIANAIRQIEGLHFECEAGPLENCEDWQELKRLLKEAGYL
jgi:hypothetical protein